MLVTMFFFISPSHWKT